MSWSCARPWGRPTRRRGPPRPPTRTPPSRRGRRSSSARTWSSCATPCGRWNEPRAQARAAAPDWRGHAKSVCYNPAGRRPAVTSLISTSQDGSRPEGPFMAWMATTPWSDDEHLLRSHPDEEEEDVEDEDDLDDELDEDEDDLDDDFDDEDDLDDLDDDLDEDTEDAVDDGE